MVITEGKSHKRDLMDAGFLAPWIAEFGSNLDALEHSSLTVRGYTIPPALCGLDLPHRPAT